MFFRLMVLCLCTFSEEVDKEVIYIGEEKQVEKKKLLWPTKEKQLLWYKKHDE